MGGFSLVSLFTEMGSAGATGAAGSVIDGANATGLAESSMGSAGSVIDGAKNIGENIKGEIKNKLPVSGNGGNNTEIANNQNVNNTEQKLKPKENLIQNNVAANSGINASQDAVKKANEADFSKNAFGKGLLTGDSIISKTDDGSIDWGNTLLSAGGRFLQGKIIKPITGATGDVLKMGDIVKSLDNSSDEEDDEMKKKKKKENKGV